MLTDDDIKKLMDNFVTKQEFNQAIENMATKVQMNRVLDLVDTVLGEVKAMRLEQAVHAQRHDDIDKDLEKIKSIPFIAHQLNKN